jgi:hypothetical protein
VQRPTVLSEGAHAFKSGQVKMLAGDVDELLRHDARCLDDGLAGGSDIAFVDTLAPAVDDLRLAGLVST